jgi:preprotein translocase subunit SecG
MQILFVILIVLASAILGLIVLVQNPKGGGLAGNIAGFSTQFMGVKQTTDVLEKGTWIFGGVIAALCLASSIFISSSGTTVTGPDRSKDATGASIPANQQQQPGGANTLNLNPQAKPDSTK